MENSEKKPDRIDRALAAIPRVMAGKVSIFIYIFLLFYLVIFALICFVVPALGPFAPGSDVQLVLGNYTNVLSALGASIAAGSGVAIHSKVKALHRRHDELRDSIDSLHRKIDGLQKDTEEIETEQKKLEK